MQAHACPATTMVDGVEFELQPQAQPQQRQSTQGHEEAEGTFMRIS
jgi:hypothetical protein